MTGSRPKPIGTHLLEGTYRHDRHLVRQSRALGRPRTPGGLSERAGQLWRKFLPLMPWLRASDAPSFALFVTLFSEFEAGPGRMPAARIAVLRAVANDLGLSPNARHRLPLPDRWPSDDADDGDGGESFAEYLSRRPRRPTD